MGYYPIFLDIRTKPVVVAGGGEVALRKVEGLVEAGAEVTVISPVLHPELTALLEQGRIRHIARPYRAGDMEGYSLAFVATDEGASNAAVAAEGRDRGVWVNAVDDPKRCDFITPAVLRRGQLTLAISTSGGSPAAARKIREELEHLVTEEYWPLLEVAAEVRQGLRKRGVKVGAQSWNAALDGDFRQLLREGRRAEAKARLLTALLEAAGTR
jgi:precorrin-2 dehydrogenase/sirohydrochlorin ferrochelatase